jgi:hypothetical protein
MLVWLIRTPHQPNRENIMAYAHLTAASKIKAATSLPAIDACQSGIFHELRNRETRILRARPCDSSGKQPRLFLFRQHLNALFAQPTPQFS